MNIPFISPKNPFELYECGRLESVLRRIRLSGNISRLQLSPRLDSEQQRMVNELRREGTLVLKNYVPADLLCEMRHEVQVALEGLQFETPCLAQARLDPGKHARLIENFLYASSDELVKLGVTINRQDVRDFEQVVRELNPSTLTVYMLELSDAFRRVWLDPFLLTIVSHYLGLVPKLTEAYVRRNFPARFWTMNHFWHRDLNDRHLLLKVFVFLSDCSIHTGPHEYIRRSHRDFTHLNGKRYYTDADVDALHPIGSPLREVSEVKAGTVIIEDTRGLHRARMPEQAFRDLGYAVFMPLPDGTEPALYRFPRAAHTGLSDFQRAFIPSGCLI